MTVKPVNDPKERPYPPSWLDYLSGRLRRLPGPSWTYYLGLGLSTNTVILSDST